MASAALQALLDTNRVRYAHPKNDAAHAVLPRESVWTLSELQGRLVQISGAAATSCLMPLLRQAQAQQEPIAWLLTEDSAVYPPDLAENGIDLQQLVFVRVVPKTNRNAMPLLVRSIDRLLRSGAVGFIVADMRGFDLRRSDPLSLAMQTGLAALAQTYHAAVIFVTQSGGANRAQGGMQTASAEDLSLGPLISLRAVTYRRYESGNRFAVHLHVVKDKSNRSHRSRDNCGGPAWSKTPCVYYGPPGLH